MCSRRLLELGGAIAVTVLVLGSSAFADPLPKEDQKCIDQYNNKLRLVSATAGKDYRSCIKSAGKGTPGAEGCLTGDTPGKIAGKAQKVTDLYTAGTCTGSEPIQQGAVTGNAAHTQGPLDLTHDILGDPVNDLTVVSVDKATAKCQDKMVQRSGQAFTEIVKAQRSCKKNAMKAGTVVDSASLNAICGTYAQIDSGGKAAGKLSKLSGDVAAACATLTPSVVAPGLCSASPTAAALGVCLVARTRCEACLTLNAADGQSMNCDIFDDTVANNSCGGGLNVGTHTCTLAAGSSIQLGTQALPLGLNPTGTVQIACGTTDGAGKAACGCNVQSFGVLVIPAIGDVCINPATCPSGEIDCDGGNAEDVDLVADHNIGTCTNDTTCGTTCNAFCGGLGAQYVRLSYGCEGFCQGGPNNNNACTMDSQCTGGACTGAEPVVPSHAGKCNCTCQGEGLGSPAPAGALSCEVGTQINVELPSNGVCDQAIPTIQLAPVCGAVTTTNAKGLVNNANNTPAKTIPPVNGVGTAPETITGTGITCGTMSTSTVTGLKLVGHLGFFDSTLGDIFSTNKFICQ